MLSITSLYVLGEFSAGTREHCGPNTSLTMCSTDDFDDVDTSVDEVELLLAVVCVLVETDDGCLCMERVLAPWVDGSEETEGAVCTALVSPFLLLAVGIVSTVVTGC